MIARRSLLQAGLATAADWHDSQGVDLGTDVPLSCKGGRAIHAVRLVQVKPPAESKQPWDCRTLKRTIPAGQAFRPMNQGGCKMRQG